MFNQVFQPVWATDGLSVGTDGQIVPAGKRPEGARAGGRFGAPQSPYAVTPLRGRAGINWARLLGALVVSCMFHAALFLAPHLGIRSVASGAGAKAAKLPGGAHLLNATLAPERRPVPAKTGAHSATAVVEEIGRAHV